MGIDIGLVGILVLVVVGLLLPLVGLAAALAAVVLVVLVIAFQVFADHHVGMRAKPVFGEDGGDSFRRSGHCGRS